MKYLISDASNIKEYYLKLGRHLSEFKRENYHLDFGFESFEDCIQVNLGMDKGSVSRCINVYRRFGCKNVVEKYKDYNYSQLVEMLPMDDQELEQIEPDMSAREIRKLRKFLKMNEDDALSSCVSASRPSKITVDNEPKRITKGGFMTLLKEQADKICKKYDNIVSVGSLVSGEAGTKEIYVHVKSLPGMNEFEAGQYKIVIQKMKGGNVKK